MSHTAYLGARKRKKERNENAKCHSIIARKIIKSPDY